jgi:polar amino acid transport system permease protein
MNLPPFLNQYTLQFLGQALLATLFLAVVGLSVGALLGLALGLARDKRINPIAPLRALVVFLVEFGRRIPFLVFLFIVFFGLQIAGWSINNLVGATVAVALRAAFYFSESIRSGVESISQSQWDAAATMNLGRWQTLRLVVLPQAWPLIVGPSTVLFIQLLKATSIASQIGVVELTAAAKLLNVRGYSALVCFGVILAAYYILAIAVARLGGWAKAKAMSRRRDPLPVPVSISKEVIA